MATQNPPRRIDRNRRARLIAAAIEVMEADGVHALTHRRAAAAAGVPLAATTYYFDSLGDLLSAALEQVVAGDLVAMRERLDSLPENGSIARLLAHVICESVTVGKTTSVLTTEFWAVALRHAEVREIALGWHAAWLEMLAPRLGEDRARAVMAAVAGLSQQALLTRVPPTEEHMTAILLNIVPDQV